MQQAISTLKNLFATNKQVEQRNTSVPEILEHNGKIYKRLHREESKNHSQAKF